MPEGDTIFRTARTLGRALIGKPVTRFHAELALLRAANDDRAFCGLTIDRIESRGKWLLMHFSDTRILASHMLMSGSWHIYRHGERWQQPRSKMRILIETADLIAVGFAVPVARILTPRQLDRSSRIPVPAIDVLSADFDHASAVERIAGSGGEEIADVLLHQEVLAGVGNEFKSEICFVCGQNPFALVHTLAAERIEALVAASVRLVKANVLEDSGDTMLTYGGRWRRTTHASDPAESVWVYGRAGDPCRVCGTPILSRMQGPDCRVTFWCPECQR